MVDVERARAVASVGRVEAIALGQKVFERAGGGRNGRRRRTIARGEACRRVPFLSALGAVTDPAVLGRAPHVRREVGKVHDRARNSDRERIGGVEAEEEHAGPIPEPDVRADIELGERRQPRQCRNAARRHVRHPERHDSDPCLSIEQIDLERCRNLRPELRDVDRPVREQQVVPGLRHQPRRGGHRPWAMGGLFQDPVVEIAHRGASIEEALPPFGPRHRAGVESSKQAVAASCDDRVHRIGDARRDEQTGAGRGAPCAAETDHRVQDRSRPRQHALTRRLPAGDHEDRIELRRIVAERHERAAREFSLQLREAQNTRSIARQQEPDQTIAQTAHAVVAHEGHVHQQRAYATRIFPRCNRLRD